MYKRQVIQHGAEFNLGLHKYQGDNYSPRGHKYIREFECEKVPTTIYLSLIHISPRYRGEEEVCKETNTYLRIFGKPYTKLNRRMGVVVCYAPNGSDLDALRDKCKAVAAKVEVY